MLPFAPIGRTPMLAIAVTYKAKPGKREEALREIGRAHV